MEDTIEIFLDNGMLNKNKIKEDWVKTNLPDLYSQISDFEHKIVPLKFSQLMWHYMNGLREYPICIWCGSENKRFSGLMDGYKNGCSRSCAIQLTRPMSNETRKKNTMDKWGVEHTSQLSIVKEKFKRTNRDKYGVDHPVQCKEVHDKIKKTNLEKTGFEFPLQSKEIMDKTKETLLHRYGFDNSTKSPSVIKKIRDKSIEKWGENWPSKSDSVKSKIIESNKKRYISLLQDRISENPDIEFIGMENGLVQLKCESCQSIFEITPNLLYQRGFKHNIKICLECNPLNTKTTNGHVEISDFLKEISIDIRMNVRDIISPYELDIYLPEQKIAIEFNGIYWHSELHKNKKYHKEKLDKTNNLGIQLIQIWEDDWNEKKQIVKSILRSKIGKCRRIGARKCSISEISDSETKLFLNENHIQGWAVSKLRYGLYLKDELVSVMTFSRGRKNMGGKSDEWEIVRYCNKIDTNVIGGITKLWSRFLKDVSPSKVISYCDQDFFDGESYIRLGMSQTGESLNYTWCDGIKRHNRWNFRKDKLVREGFDPSMSEKEIMYQRKWFRCWGSGNKKFEISFD
jgi:hypothetical protein